jgi:hypothetical protein
MARHLTRGLVGGVLIVAGAMTLVSSADAVPDTGPVTGDAVATQSGACGGRPDGTSVPFTITAQIQHDVLTLTDPGGTTSGPINADGTAHLSGNGQSYDVVSQSADDRMLTMREVSQGCPFNTIVTFAAGFPALATSAAPPPTSAPAPTPTQQSPVAPTPRQSPTTPTHKDSGTSLAWLWGVVLVAGIVSLSTGVVLYRRKGPVRAHTCTNAEAEVAAAEREVKILTERADALYRDSGYLRLEGAIFSDESNDDANERELATRLREADARLARAREALKRCQAGGPDIDANPRVDPDPPRFDAPLPPEEPRTPDPDERQEIG